MLPVELACQQHEAQAELLLRVDADLFWFRGHFPQQPLLPDPPPPMVPMKFSI